MSIKSSALFDICVVTELAEELAEQSGYTQCAAVEYKDEKLILIHVSENEVVTYMTEADADLFASMEAYFMSNETATPAEEFGNQWNAVIAAMEEFRLISVDQVK